MSYKWVRVKTEDMTIEEILNLIGEKFIFYNGSLIEQPLVIEAFGEDYKESTLYKVTFSNDLIWGVDYKWYFYKETEGQKYLSAFSKIYKKQKVLKSYYNGEKEGCINIRDMKFNDLEKLLGKKFQCEIYGGHFMLIGIKLGCWFNDQYNFDSFVLRDLIDNQIMHSQDIQEIEGEDYDI